MQGVTGSSPVVSTKMKRTPVWCPFHFDGSTAQQARKLCLRIWFAFPLQSDGSSLTVGKARNIDALHQNPVVYLVLHFSSLPLDILILVWYNCKCQTNRIFLLWVFFYLGDIIPFFCIPYVIWTSAKMRTPRRRVCYISLSFDLFGDNRSLRFSVR